MGVRVSGIKVVWWVCGEMLRGRHVRVGKAGAGGGAVVWWKVAVVVCAGGR